MSWMIWGWIGEGGGRMCNILWGEFVEGWDILYLSSKGEIEVVSMV